MKITLQGKSIISNLYDARITGEFTQVQTYFRPI